jgi:hypothetical protein
MAKAKKNSFVSVDLEWAEQQLASWKAYVDANPIKDLRDRVIGERVVATKEVTGKFIQETMKNYLALIEIVDKLREQEEQKQLKIRGDDDLTPLERGEI